MSKWLTTITNLAVLGGLVLVAIELNQNSELARIANINEGSSFENGLWFGLMGDAPTEIIERAAACPEQMSYADFVAVDAYLFTALNTIYRNYEIANEGLYSEAQWKAEVDTYVHWYLGDDFGRAWWEGDKVYFEVAFSSYVDSVLSKKGINSFQAWQNLKKRLGIPAESAREITEACH